MGKPLNVTVVALHALTVGNLKAFASVKIGPLTLHNFRIVQQPGQRAYVSVPQHSYTNAAGKTQYRPAMEMPAEWKDSISAAILAKWQSAQGEGP